MLEFWAFFRNNGPIHGANLQADAAIDAGFKVDPVVRRAFRISRCAGMNAGHRAGIHTIGNPFTNIRNDRVGHGNDL